MNQSEREREYQALRKYIKLISDENDTDLPRALRLSLDEDLTSRQRQLVRMYYIDQMLMADIAEELGIDVSTVSRTLKRARARLRQSLQRCGAGILQHLEN